jgi:TRAP-type C4-dicarboxylate transport system permease small subunit
MAIAAQNYDFHAFYCAGAVAREGGNPYLAEPLRACERMRDTVLPAPFPGYVIAAMEPLSRLSFASASKIWTAMVVIAIAGCALLLMPLTRSGAAFVAAVLCLSLGVTSLGFGEYVPFFLCALCIAALCAQRGRWAMAAAAASACLIEPHLGVPVCAALFIWQPRTRAILASVALLLAVISVAAIGWGENVEYLTRVLPFHALSEIGSNRQFSLSAIVHALGGSDQWALRAGLFSYATMVFAGVVLARRAARHFRNDAFLVAVPAAAAMIGGSFLHVTQIAAAIPLALLLLREAPQYRAMLSAAIVCLAIPWLWIYQPLLIALAGIFAFYVVWETTQQNAVAACTSAAVVLAALLGLNAWSGRHAPTAPAPANARVAIPAQYAESRWAIANLGYWSSGSAVSWAYRAPTWCGLLLVLGSLCLVLRHRAPREAVPAAAPFGVTA